LNGLKVESYLGWQLSLQPTANDRGLTKRTEAARRDHNSQPGWGAHAPYHRQSVRTPDALRGSVYPEPSLSSAYADAENVNKQTTLAASRSVSCIVSDDKP